MTCNHVLGLIDAGRLAGYSRAHLEAAARHAQQCVTCGPAMEASAVLTAGLAALPHPVPMRDFAPGVLARIEQIEAARASVAATAPESTRRTIDWPAWAIVPGALVAALAFAIASAGGASSRSSGITAGLASMPSDPLSVLALAAGLAVFVAGLLAPLGLWGRPLRQ